MKSATQLSASLAGIAAAFTLVLVVTLSGTAPAARDDRPGRDSNSDFGVNPDQPGLAVHSYAGCAVPAANDDGLGITKQRPVGAAPACVPAPAVTPDHNSGNRLKPIGPTPSSPRGLSRP